MIARSFCLDNFFCVLLLQSRIVNPRYRGLVILHLMAEFGARQYKIPWKYKILEKDYKIPKDLNKVKERIDTYAFEGKSKLKFYTNKQIEAKRKNTWQSQKELDDFNTMVADHNILLELRNQYLHCSASMDGVGMEHIQDNQSNIIWKRKIIAG